MPVLGTSSSAGYDIFCIQESLDLAPLTVKKFDTGLRVTNLDEGSFILLASRSSIALTLSCFVVGGVIDSDFRGNIHCILYNGSATETAHFKKGDRICQAIILPRLSANTDQAPLKRKRDNCGFGSTGLNSKNELDLRITDAPGSITPQKGQDTPTETVDRSWERKEF